ncbi:MAG: hypothetical protein K6U74_02160 [Firmicutes bacterium]|nr:hypothetical protein [Bacillota bacterium]
MSKPKREFRLLGEWKHSGAQAAGTVWRPTAAMGNAELDTNERAEVLYMEIDPPVSSTGTPENLLVNLVLDDKPYYYDRMEGTKTKLVCARKKLMNMERTRFFGQPVFAVKDGAMGMAQATCPKYRRRVTIEALAGSGGITGDYAVRLYGYSYEPEDIPPVSIGGFLNLEDPATGKVAPISKPALVPTFDNWTQLPGGLDQAVPKIFSFTRFAVNAQPTTPNLIYEFRFETGGVATRDEDLYFPYDQEKKVIIIKGLGVRAPANLKNTWIDVGGDERPKNRWPTRLDYNPLVFGDISSLFFNFNPGTSDATASFTLYQTIPALEDRIMVHNEKAVVRVVDDGTSVGAGNIAVALDGVIVELT